MTVKRPSAPTSRTSCRSVGPASQGAETRVPDAAGSRVMPGYGCHASSRALRRVAMTQVSVDPNISSSVVPKRSSTSRASSGGSGAVAETTTATAGSDTPDSRRERRWTGVLTSTRGAGTALSACATSAGNSGCPA